MLTIFWNTSQQKAQCLPTISLLFYDYILNVLQIGLQITYCNLIRKKARTNIFQVLGVHPVLGIHIENASWSVHVNDLISILSKTICGYKLYRPIGLRTIYFVLIHSQLDCGILHLKQNCENYLTSRLSRSLSTSSQETFIFRTLLETHDNNSIYPIHSKSHICRTCSAHLNTISSRRLIKSRKNILNAYTTYLYHGENSYRQLLEIK